MFKQPIYIYPPAYLPPQKKIFTGFVYYMQISPIISNRPNNISLKANSRWIYDKNGKELYKTTTYFFRDDLDWECLIKYICNKYKNVSKVNFINHACSNGLEPLSFLMGLMIFSPENVKKFTPIIAKDINEENIIMAKNGDCGASSDDFLRIHKFTGSRYHDFFNIKRNNNTDRLFTLSPKDTLKDKIIFEQGDIFKDIDNIPKDNTFLSCRNLWMYLPFEKQNILAQKLSQRLGENSTILIGYLDSITGSADRLLTKYGFKRCSVGNEYVNIMYSKA